MPKASVKKPSNYGDELKSLNKSLRKAKLEYTEAEYMQEEAEWRMQSAEADIRILKEKIKALKLKKNEQSKRHRT